ncbi:hypothetical protein CPB97_003623, partial [Podila verticillata]
MNTVAATGPRSPQFYKPTGGTSAQNSDEILSGGIPQRPPRQNRNRSESSSSPTISGRDDSLRSGSIPYLPNANPSYHSGHSGQNHQNGSTSSASSYRSPHMSPGLPASGNLPNVPPLTLPDSFLEDQSDYAGYYSDVGAFSTTQILPQQHMLQPTPLNTAPLPRQQSFSQGDSPLSPSSRQGHRSGPIFLPSPHLTPTASPLMNDFSNMSLEPRQTGNGNRNRTYSTSLSTVSTDDSVASRNSLMPRPTDSGAIYPQEYYQGHPYVPVDSFLMPTQDQYPADSMILYGGTAVHSEGSLFRKDSKEYLMLTNSSLLKYKTMEKAAKIFGNQSVWASTSGHQLLTPAQTALITKDHRIISINSIV